MTRQVAGTNQKQKTFDEAWDAIDRSRGRRKDWLAKLKPLDATGAPIPSRLARRVTQLLQAIESHAGQAVGEGPVSLRNKTLYLQMRVSDRTLNRAIADAVGMGLLNVARSYSPTLASQYQIEWAIVAQMLLDNPSTEDVIKWKYPPGTTDMKAGVTTDMMSTTTDMMSGTTDMMSATTDMMSETTDTKSGVDTYIPRARAQARDLYHSSTMNVYRSLPCGVAGWPNAITADLLRNAESVESLFRHAVGQHWIDEGDRTRFFSLARYVRRGADDGGIENAGGFFTAAVKEKNWQGTAADEDHAIKAILMLDTCRRERERMERVGS